MVKEEEEEEEEEEEAEAAARKQPSPLGTCVRAAAPSERAPMAMHAVRVRSNRETEKRFWTRKRVCRRSCVQYVQGCAAAGSVHLLMCGHVNDGKMLGREGARGHSHPTGREQPIACRPPVDVLGRGEARASFYAALEYMLRVLASGPVNLNEYFQQKREV